MGLRIEINLGFLFVGTYLYNSYIHSYYSKKNYKISFELRYEEVSTSHRPLPL